LSQQTIEIVVSPTGQVRVETKGFVGSSCKAASEFLLKTLGQATHDVRTAEYFQQPTQSNLTREGA